MKALLDKIIEERLAETQENDQRLQAAREEFSAKAIARFTEELKRRGLQWLTDYGEITTKWISQDRRQINVYWHLALEHCATLEVSQIHAVCALHEKQVTYHTQTPSIALDGEEHPQILFYYRKYYRFEDSWSGGLSFPPVISKARGCYPAWKEEELTVKIEEAVKESKGQNALFHNWNKDETEARALHKKLCEIAPGYKADWDKQLESWLEADAEFQARKAAEEAREAKTKAALDSYRVEYSAWWKEAQAIHDENKRVAANVQKTLDAPVTLYELEYAVVAEDGGDPDFDESGDAIRKYVDTRKAVVRTPGDKQGNFLNLAHEPVRYWYPVKVSPWTVVASENPRRAYDIHGLPTPFDGDGFDICVKYIIGAASDSEIEQALKDAGWQEYPTRPERPEVDGRLPYRELNEIESRVENGTEPEFESESVNENDQEIPF